MKYYQTEMYIWDKNWDVETVEVDFLEDLEKELISFGLQRTEGNKSALAKQLGISRTSLISKVVKYGIQKKSS